MQLVGSRHFAVAREVGAEDGLLVKNDFFPVQRSRQVGCLAIDRKGKMQGTIGVIGDDNRGRFALGLRRGRQGVRTVEGAGKGRRIQLRVVGGVIVVAGGQEGEGGGEEQEEFLHGKSNRFE